MNILIAGCTSTIGRSIITEFAPNNSLFLISRKSAKDNVLKLKENALLLGSNSVTLIEYDLGDSPNSHLNEIVKNNYDLFINLASSTSKINDEDIFPLNHQFLLLDHFLIKYSKLEKIEFFSLFDIFLPSSAITVPLTITFLKAGLSNKATLITIKV